MAATATAVHLPAAAPVPSSRVPPSPKPRMSSAVEVTSVVPQRASMPRRSRHETTVPLVPHWHVRGNADDTAADSAASSSSSSSSASSSSSLSSSSFSLSRRQLLLSATSVSLAAGVPLLQPCDVAADNLRGAAEESGQRYAIVTGANTGIGKAIATALASQGIRVVLACRNREKGERAAAEVVAATGNPHVEFLQCDLASLRSVATFSDHYLGLGRPLHILVNNAGVMACPLSYTDDGFETQFGVNHLGHFALTARLLPLLAASGQPEQHARVVVVTSMAERIGTLDLCDLNFNRGRTYNAWAAYGQSKLANCLFTLELARRCAESGMPIDCNCYHPGIVATELIRYVLPSSVLESSKKQPERALAFTKFIGLRTPDEGAATGVFLATSQSMEGLSGGYYDTSRLATPSSKARDAVLAAALWAESEALVGITPRPDGSTGPNEFPAACLA